MKDIFAGLYNKIVGFFSSTEQHDDESKSVARNRLKLVLMQDRTNLNPYLLERMRGELIDLLSKYVEMDRSALDLNFENDGSSVALMLSIPVIRAKEEEEIEAALKAEDEAKKEIEEKLKSLEEKEAEEKSDTIEEKSDEDEMADTAEEISEDKEEKADESQELVEQDSIEQEETEKPEVSDENVDSSENEENIELDATDTEVKETLDAEEDLTEEATVEEAVLVVKEEKTSKKSKKKHQN